MKNLKYGILVFLIMISASLSAALSLDEEALFDAVNNNDLKTVADLLKKGVNIDVLNDDFVTPLKYATIGNRLDVINFLIARGANINSIGSQNVMDAPILRIVEAYLYVNEKNEDKVFIDIFKSFLANNADYTIKINDSDSDDSESSVENTDLLQSVLDEIDEDSDSYDVLVKRIDVLQSVLNEIIAYKKAVENDKKIDALVTAITHNGKNDSQFTKEQWIRFSLWNTYDKQILYALTKQAITTDEVLTLIAKVHNMPFDLIPQLMNKGKITFKDLKLYYEQAKEEDNKKFGQYYVKLQKINSKVSLLKKSNKD